MLCLCYTKAYLCDCAIVYLCDTFHWHSWASFPSCLPNTSHNIDLGFQNDTGNVYYRSFDLLQFSISFKLVSQVSQQTLKYQNVCSESFEYCAGNHGWIFVGNSRGRLQSFKAHQLYHVCPVCQMCPHQYPLCPVYPECGGQVVCPAE